MHPLASIFGSQSHVTLGQECARAALIFIYGLALIRLGGRRTFGKWSALDVIVSVTAGSSLSRALTGNAPLWGTLAATGVLILMHAVAGHLAARSRFFSRLVEGRLVDLLRHGRVDEQARLRHAVSQADLEEALHRKGLSRAEDATRITLEPNGSINVATS